MAEKRVTIRAAVEGGEQAKAALNDIGATGATALGRVKTAANGVQRPLGEATVAAQRMGGAFDGVAGGGGLRQTTMQLSQVAQQASATGNWLQAFAIQLPDLALAFGPVGIAAGAIGGALLMMVPALISAKSETERLEEAMKAAKASADAMSAAATAAALPIDDLRKKYGDLADEVLRANDAMAEIVRATAAQDALAAARALRGTLGRDLPNMAAYLDPQGNVMRGYEGARTKLLEQAMRDLGKQTGATASEALRLAEAISGLGKSGTMEGLIAEGEELLSAIAAITPETADQQRALGDMATQIGGVMDLAKQNVEAVTTASEGMIGSFETGISKLEQLKRTLEGMLPGAGGALGRIGDWISGFRSDTVPEFSAAGRGILDLIGHAEGTDRGRGYNETLGYGAFTGGPVNLINMTLREVRDLQRQMLNHPANTYNSSAVGRYQIVGKTLDSLMVELNLTGDELFSPEVQDRLAMQLVRRRMGQGPAGFRNEWEGLRNVPDAAIMAALGAGSVGVDPSVVAARKAENDELERGNKARQEMLATIEHRVAVAGQEAAAIGQSVYAAARERAVLELTNQLKAKGIALTEQVAGTEKTWGDVVNETADALARSAQEQAVQQERQKEAARLMRDTAQEMKGWRDDFVGTFTSAFDGVIVGTKKLGDAFSDLFGRIASEFANRGLNQLGNWLFDSLLGVFGGGDPLTAALAGAGSPVRVMHSGGWAGIGGTTRAMSWPGLRPNEVPAILERGERVLSRREAAGGGGQSVHVTVGVDPRNGNLTAFVDERAGMAAAQVGAQVERALPERIQKYRHDSRLRPR